MKNYAFSHWQQRSNTLPSQEGYEARTMGLVGLLPTPSPRLTPPTSSSASVSPYRNSAKSSLLSKHALSKNSTS